MAAELRKELSNGAAAANDHSRDSDCTVDPATNCCTVCGVEHGEPCPACRQRAFHSFDCPLNQEPYEPFDRLEEKRGDQ